MPNKVKFGPNNLETTVTGSFYEAVSSKDIIYAYPDEYTDSVNEDNMPRLFGDTIYTSFGSHSGQAYKAVTVNQYPFIYTYKLIKDDRNTTWIRLPDFKAPNDLTTAAYGTQLIDYKGVLYLIIAGASNGVYTYRLKGGSTWEFVNRITGLSAFSISATIFNNAGVEELWFATSVTSSSPFIKVYKMNETLNGWIASGAPTEVTNVSFSSDFYKTVKITNAFGQLVITSCVDAVYRQFSSPGTGTWTQAGSFTGLGSVYSVDSLYNGRRNSLITVMTTSTSPHATQYHTTSATSIGSQVSLSNSSDSTNFWHFASIYEFRGQTYIALGAKVSYADMNSNPANSLTGNGQKDLFIPGTSNFRVCNFFAIDEFLMAGSGRTSFNYNVAYFSENSNDLNPTFNLEGTILDSSVSYHVYPFSITEWNGKKYAVHANNSIASPYFDIYRLDGIGWVKWDHPSRPSLLLTSCIGAHIHNHNGTLYLTVLHPSSPFIMTYYYNGLEWIKIANPASIQSRPWNTSTRKILDMATNPVDGRLYIVYASDQSPWIITYRLNETNMTWENITNAGTNPGTTVRSVSIHPHASVLYLAIGYSSTVQVYTLNTSSQWATLTSSSLSLATTNTAVDLASFNNRSNNTNELYLTAGIGSTSPFFYLWRWTGSSWTQLSNWSSAISSAVNGVKLHDWDGILIGIVSYSSSVAVISFNPFVNSSNYFWNGNSYLDLSTTSYMFETYEKDGELYMMTHPGMTTGGRFDRGGVFKYLHPVVAQNRFPGFLDMNLTANNLSYYPYWNGLSVTEYNNKMYLAVSKHNHYPQITNLKFSDEDDWFYNYPRPRNVLLPWTTTSETTQYSTDLISFSGRLVMVMGSEVTYLANSTTENNYYHLYYKNSDAADWIKTTLPGNLPAAGVTAVCLYNFLGTLYLVLGRSSQLSVYTSSDGINWTYRTQVSISGQPYKISLMNFNGTLYATVSSSGSPFFLSYRVTATGTTWTALAQPNTIPNTTGIGTSLAVYNNELFASIAYGASPFLITYKYDLSTDRFLRLTDPDIIGLTSGARSTDMIVFEDELYLAVVGASSTREGLKLTIYEKSGNTDWVKFANADFNLPPSSEGTTVKFNIHDGRLYLITSFNRAPYMFTYILNQNKLTWNKLTKKFWGKIPLVRQDGTGTDIGIAKANAAKDETKEILIL